MIARKMLRYNDLAYNELKNMALNVLTHCLWLCFLLCFFLPFSLYLWRLEPHFLLIVNTYLSFLKTQTYDHAVLNITFKSNTLVVYISA